MRQQRSAFADATELRPQARQRRAASCRSDAHDDFYGHPQGFSQRPLRRRCALLHGRQIRARGLSGARSPYRSDGLVNDERRGQTLRESVPHIPADRLMVETVLPTYCLAISSRALNRGATSPAFFRTSRAPSRICAARLRERGRIDHAQRHPVLRLVKDW